MILLAATSFDQILSAIITIGAICAVFFGAIESAAKRIKKGACDSEPEPRTHDGHPHDSHAWEMLATERHESIELLNQAIDELKRQNALMRRYIPAHVLEAIGLGNDDSTPDAVDIHDDPKT